MESWRAAIPGVTQSGTRWVAKQQQAVFTLLAFLAFFLLKTFYSLCENSLILTNSLENVPSQLLQTSSSAPSRALLSCWV